MRLIVMFVCVAGPMGRTQHIIKSFPVPLLLIDPLVEISRRSLNMMRQVSSETHHSWTKNNSGSCRCVSRKLRIGWRILWWPHLILRWVLQHKVSCRDSTSCPWISMEADFLLDAGVTLVLYYLSGCCSVGSLKEIALLDLENWWCRGVSQEARVTPVEL